MASEEFKLIDIENAIYKCNAMLLIAWFFEKKKN